MRLSGEGLAAVRGGRAVFSDLSFSLAGGELLAVTGPNGVGKSTLLRVIAGLLRPSAGQVVAAPIDEEGLAPRTHLLGHQVGLKPALSVRQNLRFWQDYYGAGDIEAAMATMAVADLADLPAGILSAGQKRRSALARLVMAPRPVWLLDEPLTALDAASEVLLAHALSAHLEGGGLAVVATHRPLPVAATATLAMEAAA